MKQLELNLQKRLLIVEPDVYELFFKKEKYYSEIDFKIYDIKLICKGSELTEGMTKQLVHMEEVSDVEDYRHEKIFIDYNNEDNAFRCGFESFISAIQAQGYYWGENPYLEVSLQMNFDRNKENRYQKAESKTFNPEKSLIFEIL